MTILVGAIIGFVVGTFAWSNILLPLFWAWPKARQLARTGQLKTPIPTVRFVIAPLVWTAILLVLLVFAAALSESLALGYLIGFGVSLPMIARLVTNPSQHMEADFADTYGPFLKGESMSRTVGIKKQAAAVARIAVNLWEQAAGSDGNAPRVLHWKLPDSRFRYMMFCLGTVHIVCPHLMKEPKAVLSQSFESVIQGAVSYKGADGLFAGRAVDAQQAWDEGNTHLKEFFDGWGTWINTTRADPGNARAGTSIVCSMLRKTESDDPATEADRVRLWPLACWFEDYIPTIGEAFGDLTS